MSGNEYEHLKAFFFIFNKTQHNKADVAEICHVQEMKHIKTKYALSQLQCVVFSETSLGRKRCFLRDSRGTNNSDLPNLLANE